MSYEAIDECERQLELAKGDGGLTQETAETLARRLDLELKLEELRSRRLAARFRQAIVLAPVMVPLTGACLALLGVLIGVYLQDRNQRNLYNLEKLKFEHELITAATRGTELETPVPPSGKRFTPTRSSMAGAAANILFLNDLGWLSLNPRQLELLRSKEGPEPNIPALPPTPP